MDMERVLMVARWERGFVGMGEEVKGLRSTNRQLQNSHGDIKYSIGNGVARELTHMTHGHELRSGFLEGRGYGVEGKGRKIGTNIIA